MQDEPEDANPTAQLRASVGERMLADGWTLLEQDLFDPPGVGTYALAVAADFVATCVIDNHPWTPEDDDVAVAAAVLGLDYRPTRELTTTLIGSAWSGVVLKEPHLVVRLPDPPSITTSVDEIVIFAREQAQPVADLADLDTVIGLLRAGLAEPASSHPRFLRKRDGLAAPDPLWDSSGGSKLIAWLLVAAGRYAEAGRELETIQADGDGPNRGLRHLTRWIDGAGSLTLPDTPPEWPSGWLRDFPSRQRQQPAGFADAFATAMPEVSAKNEAVDAVRAVSAGKSRDQLRAMLTDELARRGAAADPLSVERSVHVMLTAAEPLGKLKLASWAVKALVQLGQSGRPQAQGSTGAPKVATADKSWMAPPPRACYPVYGCLTAKAAVELDPAATAVLERAMNRAGPDLWAFEMVDAWLHADAEPSDPSSHPSVCLGEHRVGQLDEAATGTLRPALVAAAQRDEAPRMRGRLSRIPGELPFMLVLDMPKPA